MILVESEIIIYDVLRILFFFIMHQFDGAACDLHSVPFFTHAMPDGDGTK